MKIYRCRPYIMTLLTLSLVIPGVSVAQSNQDSEVAATWERRSLRSAYSRDVLHPIGLPCLASVWRVSLFPMTRCRSNLCP